MATFQAAVLTTFAPLNAPPAGASTGLLGSPPPGLGAILGAGGAPLSATAPPPTPLGGTPEPTVLGNARIRPYLTGGVDWYERLHVLPKRPIDFGRVVAETDVEFEIFSAFGRPVVFTGLSSVRNAGLSIPELPPIGTVLAPFSSLLDPSSSPGVPILLVLRASADGSQTFDSEFRFSFTPGGVAVLRASGVRFEVLPFEHQSPVREVLRFATTVLQVIAGREQRIARRAQPRQIFDCDLVLEGRERRTMQSILFGAQGRMFGLPLWHERMLLAAPVAADDPSATVVTAQNVDIRVGGFALLIHDSLTWDVVKVASVASPVVSFDDAFPLPANDYEAGDALVPLRIVILGSRVQMSTHPSGVEEQRLLAMVVDNETGAPAGDLSPHAVIYGHPFLDIPNFVIDGALSETYAQKVVVIDSEVGQIYQEQVLPRNVRRHALGFYANTRAEVMALRKLLIGLAGPQVCFWLATNADDLLVVATLSSGTDTMDIEACAYVAHVRSRHTKALVRVTFTDGSSLIRKIIDAETISATVERLTLDDDWPSTKTADQVRRVEFIELCRIATNEITIEHQEIGIAEATIALSTVFDEGP